jgi:HNH endonuclease
MLSLHKQNVFNMEQFKPFPLNQSVMVGNRGTIIRPNGKKASLKPDNIGYLKISIVVNGRLVPFKQHRVISMTWIDNFNQLPEVNHVDGNKLNNAVNNLQWVTHQQNIQHAYSTGIKKPNGRKLGYKLSEDSKYKCRLAKLGKTKRKIDGKWKWFDK